MEVKNCKNLEFVEVGQTIFLSPAGNFARRYPKNTLIEAVVTKIEKKYFYLKSQTDKFVETYQFPLDGGNTYDHDSNSGYNVFSSREKFMKDAELTRRKTEISAYFNRSAYCGIISEDAVNRIYDILESEGVLDTMRLK